MLLALIVALGGGVVGLPPPFKSAVLAVLVVEESTPGDSFNAPVWVNSTKAGGVRDYVEKTRKGRFRLLDQHNPTDLANKEWQDAMNVKRDSVPWIVAAGPNSGFSMALPATEAETMKLLEGVK
jgi:hypothetical protein